MTSSASASITRTPSNTARHCNPIACVAARVPAAPPPTRGWTLVLDDFDDSGLVSPAYAGMDLVSP